MIKRKEKFKQIKYNQLYQITERVLEKFIEEENWRIEKENIKDKERSWNIRSSLKNYPTLFPEINKKKLLIEVKEEEISLNCVDRWPKLTFDVFNKKKKIVNKFLEELKKEIKKIEK